MTENTRMLHRFEYHVEDLDCRDCLYYERKTKSREAGCGLDSCPFEGIRQDAIANGRLHRPKGWFSCRE